MDEFPVQQPLKLLGCDSLALYSIARMINLRYKIQFSHLFLIQHQMNLVNVVDFIMNGSDSLKKIQIDLSFEYEKISNKVKKKWENQSDAILSLHNSWKNILVTGATGFLGSFLVAYLLENSLFHVFCIVRGKDENLATINQYFIEN